MKKLLILAVSVILLGSCSSMGSMARFTKTSTYTEAGVIKPMTAVIADLDVASEKISHLFIPGKTIKAGGFDNILNCAVQEALEANGNADVLVALEKQIKYNKKGDIESVVVTGYPAKYVNFRSPGDDYIREISKQNIEEKSSKGSLLGKFKL